MEKGFERMKTDMGSIAKDAEKMGKRINDVFSNMDIESPIAAARAKVSALESQLEATTAEFKFAISEDDDKSAERLGRKMASIYDHLEAAREKLAREVTKAARKQAKEEEKAAERSRKAAERESKAKEKAMQRSYREATRGVRRFGTRMREIISGALVFNLVSAGFREMVSYFGEALKTSESYRYAVGRLKGALLTVFQYIYEYILPIIIKFINYLTMAAQAVARLFSAISGKSTSQMAANAKEMYEQIHKTEKETKKLKRDLMGFDELNRLSEKEEEKKEEDDTIKPIFEDIGEWDLSKFKIPEWLSEMLELVGAIGAALLGWKIGRMFFDTLREALGLAVGLAGAFIYVYNWVDALINGINWDNFGGILVGLGLAVAGFGLAFGPVGSAIALLVGGIGMVILAMREWIKTGELSNAACATLVAGIMAIGAAFTIFTTNWIPLLIAAIVSLLAIVAKNADKIKEKLNKFGEWLKKVFCRDWQEVFGVILGTAMNVLVDVTGGAFRMLKDILFGFLDILTGVFTLNWRKIWDGLVSIVKGAINGIIGILNGLISLVIGAVNLMLKGLYTVGNTINKLSGKQTFSVPQITPPKIPYLARGAVIPPNAPFMAVLGDQRHGTNIEAPEDLIRKIVREESGSNTETLAVLRAILSAVQASGNNRIVINGRDVFQTIVDENNRATRIYGASPLKV